MPVHGCRLPESPTPSEFYSRIGFGLLSGSYPAVAAKQALIVATRIRYINVSSSQGTSDNQRLELNQLCSELHRWENGGDAKNGRFCGNVCLRSSDRLSPSRQESYWRTKRPQLRFFEVTFDQPLCSQSLTQISIFTFI